MQKSIEAYLEDHSNVGSNRMVKLKNAKRLNSERYVPVRYLEDDKAHLFNKSPFKDIISKSTFYKYANIDAI